MINIPLLLARIKIDSSEIGYTPGSRGDRVALDNILEMVYAWAGIIAVLIIVIASILFITSRGDPAQMKRSKDALRGAVIGLVVVLIAFAITRFVIGGLQG